MDFDAANDQLARARLAGVAFGVPVLIGVATGVPQPIVLAYLVFAIPIYAWFVFRRRPPRARTRDR